jgi:hypothetical protein
MRWWRFCNPVKAAYANLKYHAKSRKKFFDLTYDQFCEIILPTKYITDKGRESFCLHIDRIDPAKGYTFDNVQILTCSENSGKGNRQRYVDEKIAKSVQHASQNDDIASDSDLDHDSFTIEIDPDNCPF